jgi:Tol biopolymer transport system component
MASVVPRAWVATQQHDPGNGGPLGVYLMQLDGSGRQRLANGLDNAFVSGQGFGWSPDGSDLAIARGSAVDLVTPGSPERAVVQLPGPVFLGARFSRDGAWIHFARAGAGLFRVRPDGTGLQHLGIGGTVWGEDYRPSPSPDGTAVVYGSFRSPCGQEDCIRILDVATSTDRVFGPNDFLVRGTNAAWSPTGDLIAYASRAGVGVIRPDGSGQRVLAADVRIVSWMDWSPDGRWLLVSGGTGPVLLFDMPSGRRIPVPTLSTYGATAWRP